MVSIILPYTRHDGAERCIEAVRENAGGVVYELIAEEDKERIGCNPMVNRLVERANFEIVCFVHDDSVPQKGFLCNALETMTSFEGGYGCVGFNDLIYDESGPCTHWMIHKKMLKYFVDGVFYSEEYIHTKCDLELKEVCDAVGRYRWNEKAIIKHLSPIHYRLGRDKLHRKCYGTDALKKDNATYLRRRRIRELAGATMGSVFANRDDYVILKMSDNFPAYTIGSDVDILCRDQKKFAKHIQKLIPESIVKTRASHLQVDVKLSGKLVIKFDLIQSAKEYGLNSDDIFKNRLKVSRNGSLYYVPCGEDELKIRGVEYKKNRNKTWHRDYIEKHGEIGLFPCLEPRVSAQV